MPDFDLAQQTLLETILPVAGIAAGLWLVLSLIAGSARAAALAALALAAALAFWNYWKEADGLPWLPEQKTLEEQTALTWLMPLIFSSLLVGLAAAWPRTSRFALGALAIHQALLATLVLALPCWRESLPLRLTQVKAEWFSGLEAETLKTLDLIGLLAAFALVVLGNWLLLDRTARRAPDALLPLVLGISFLNAGLVINNAGLDRQRDVSLWGAGFAGLAAAALVHWLLKRALTRFNAVPATYWIDARGALGLAAALLPGLLLVTQANAVEPLPWTSPLLFACAPLALLVTLLPPVVWWRGWRLAFMATALVLGPVSVATWLAL